MYIQHWRHGMPCIVDVIGQAPQRLGCQATTNTGKQNRDTARQAGTLSSFIGSDKRGHIYVRQQCLKPCDHCSLY
jgi:hypothetical protein